jgi:hypothetical protein
VVAISIPEVDLMRNSYRDTETARPHSIRANWHSLGTLYDDDEIERVREEVDDKSVSTVADGAVDERDVSRGVGETTVRPSFAPAQDGGFDFLSTKSPKQSAAIS